MSTLDNVESRQTKKLLLMPQLVKAWAGASLFLELNIVHFWVEEMQVVLFALRGPGFDVNFLTKIHSAEKVLLFRRISVTEWIIYFIENNILHSTLNSIFQYFHLKIVQLVFKKSWFRALFYPLVCTVVWNQVKSRTLNAERKILLFIVLKKIGLKIFRWHDELSLIT